MLITGATVMTVKAQVPPYAIHNVSLNWTVYMPDTSSTNKKNGTITDTYKHQGYNTASYLKDLGAAMGVSVKGATLVAISELSLGSNFTDVTPVLVVQNYSYITNGDTNTIFVTNAAPPLTGYVFISTNYSAANLSAVSYNYITNTDTGLLTATNVPPVTSNTVVLTNMAIVNEALQTNTIIVATNVTYYIKTAKSLIPITNTSFISTEAFNVTTTNFEEVQPTALLSSSFLNFIQSTNEPNRAQQYTNGSGIFQGTIKTNLAITGTEYLAGEEFNIDAIVSGTPAAAGSKLAMTGGAGTATAVTATVGKGKTAVPWSTWNFTLTGTGSGTLGGTYFPIATNTFITQLGTNAAVTNGVNVYFDVTNATNVRLTGSVTHTFSHIVQQ